MSDFVTDVIMRLSRCTFLPGSSEKRFVRQMVARANENKPLTEKQLMYLGQIRYRYRKQLKEEA